MENKTSKYFKYAIGEIILVVIGILIALQINNWNEAKISQNRIHTYAKNLVNDLKNDISETEIRIKRISSQINYIGYTADYFRHKNINDFNNIDAVYEIYIGYGYRPFTWYTATIEEIKNSGSLKLIKNDSLRNKIISYYAFTEHLNEDYNTDNNFANLLEVDQSKIINTNYPNREVFFDSLRSYYGKTKKEWLESETYINAKKENLSLLTNNMNDIHVLINNLFKYRMGLKTRADSELPRLIKNAEEIIAIIETEYHD